MKTQSIMSKIATFIVEQLDTFIIVRIYFTWFYFIIVKKMWKWHSFSRGQCKLNAKIIFYNVDLKLFNNYCHCCYIICKQLIFFTSISISKTWIMIITGFGQGLYGLYMTFLHHCAAYYSSSCHIDNLYYSCQKKVMLWVSCTFS